MKKFCPNCEAEVPCTHEAELYVCDICGEDFAQYIVSRNANVSDVSMTQDVLTSIKTPNSIENTNPDYYKQEIDRLTAELAELRERARWISVKERLPENNEVVNLWDRITSSVCLAQFHQFKRYGVWYIDGDEWEVKLYKDQFTLWQRTSLPEPPEEIK